MCGKVTVCHISVVLRHRVVSSYEQKTFAITNVTERLQIAQVHKAGSILQIFFGLPSTPLEVAPLKCSQVWGCWILVHFSLKIWHMVATVLMIFLISWSKNAILDCTFWLTFKLKIDPGMRSILLQRLTILRALNTALYNKKYTVCQTRHFIQEAYIGWPWLNFVSHLWPQFYR